MPMPTSIRIRQNSLLHSHIALASGACQSSQDLTCFLVRNCPELPVEMHKRPWRTADDGTVRVRASLRFGAIFVLALAVKVRRENGGFQSGVCGFVVGINKWREVFERRRCL